MKEFGQGSGILVINGRIIKEFGEADEPVRSSPVNDHHGLKRGQGGTAVMLSRINPGRTLEVSVMPGSSDSAFLAGLLTSGKQITASWTTIGTGEKIVYDEGVPVNISDIGRGGYSPSDDVYRYDFNKYIPVMGV